MLPKAVTQRTRSLDWKVLFVCCLVAVVYVLMVDLVARSELMEASQTDKCYSNLGPGASYDGTGYFSLCTFSSVMGRWCLEC